jgi:hypothetical protein
MAKPFYSLEEVCQTLGMSEQDVRGLVREGKLREFRDAGKVFFKSEDVDKLKAESSAAESGADASGESGEIALQPAEAEEELPALSDESGGTSILGLAPEAEEQTEPTEQEKKEGTVITASGIGVFDDEELEIDADPMAATQVTAGATDDAVSLEGTGSGSGLLDLQREADDTSLGAELLDEIYPGEDESAPAPPPAEAPAVEPEPEEAEPVAEAEEEPALAAAAAEPAAVRVPAVAGDPTEGLFGGLLIGALVLLALAASVAAASLQGFLPDYAQTLTNRFWFFLGGAALVPIVCLLVGWIIGRTAR